MDEVTRPTRSQKLRDGVKSAHEEATSPQTKSSDASPRKTPDISSPLSAHTVSPPSSSINRRSQRASANVTPGAYNGKFHPMDARLRPVRAAKALGKRRADPQLFQDDGNTLSKRQCVVADDELTELTPIPAESENVDDGSPELDSTHYGNQFLTNVRSSPSEDELALPNPAPVGTEIFVGQGSGLNIAGNSAHSFATGRMFEPPCAYEPSPHSFVALHQVAPIGEQYQVSSSPGQSSSISQIIEATPASTRQAAFPTPVALDMYDADYESDWSLIDGPATSANYDADDDSRSAMGSRSETSSFGPSRDGLIYETIHARQFLVEPDNPWLQQPKSIFRHMTLLDRRLYRLQSGQLNDGSKLPFTWEEVIAKLVGSGDIIVTRGDMLTSRGDKLVVKGDDLVTANTFVTFADFERWGGVPALVARYEILYAIVRGSDLRND